MKTKTIGVACCVAAFVATATVSNAQDKYTQFIGIFSASVEIAKACKGMTAAAPDGVASLARSQYGLRRQKTLRLLYYSKTAWLVEQGQATLAQRGLNVSDTASLCRFGRKVAGTEDMIGQFLRSQ